MGLAPPPAHRREASRTHPRIPRRWFPACRFDREICASGASEGLRVRPASSRSRLANGTTIRVASSDGSEPRARVSVVVVSPLARRAVGPRASRTSAVLNPESRSTSKTVTTEEGHAARRLRRASLTSRGSHSASAEARLFSSCLFFSASVSRSVSSPASMLMTRTPGRCVAAARRADTPVFFARVKWNTKTSSASSTRFTEHHSNSRRFASSCDLPASGTSTRLRRSGAAGADGSTILAREARRRARVESACEREVPLVGRRARGVECRDSRRDTTPRSPRAVASRPSLFSSPDRPLMDVRAIRRAHLGRADPYRVTRHPPYPNATNPRSARRVASRHLSVSSRDYNRLLNRTLSRPPLSSHPSNTAHRSTCRHTLFANAAGSCTGPK